MVIIIILLSTLHNRNPNSSTEDTWKREEVKTRIYINTNPILDIELETRKHDDQR